MQQTDVSVVIVNWNTRDLVLDCISSILANVQDLAIEIVVVDNNSSDGSVAAISERFPKVNIIASERNLGFAAGNNLGLRSASGDYVLLLNPDTVVLDDAIRQMRDFLANRPDAGAVGCKLLNEDGSNQECFWMRFPDTRWLLKQALYLNKLNRLETGALQAVNQAFPVAHLLGACFMMRRSQLEELGGFDESYFLYLEETDLFFRLADKGLAIYHMPGARVVHYGQQSSRKAADWANVQLQRSMYQFLMRSGSCNVAARITIKAVMLLAAGVRLTLWLARLILGREDRHYAKRMLAGYARLFCSVPRFVVENRVCIERRK
ncbi:MAG: glycosyltransferase family 2 protein [Armatimonadota bacterium]|nr:glycosyltransferase family 2 protein [bacterium]